MYLEKCCAGRCEVPMRFLCVFNPPYFFSSPSFPHPPSPLRRHHRKNKTRSKCLSTNIYLYIFVCAFKVLLLLLLFCSAANPSARKCSVLDAC